LTIEKDQKLQALRKKFKISSQFSLMIAPLSSDLASQSIEAEGSEEQEEELSPSPKQARDPSELNFNLATTPPKPTKSSLELERQLNDLEFEHFDQS
jgi:hypothetical protein